MPSILGRSAKIAAAPALKTMRDGAQWMDGREGAEIEAVLKPLRLCRARGIDSPGLGLAPEPDQAGKGKDSSLGRC